MVTGVDPLVDHRRPVLVSLLEMLQLHAHRFIEALGLIRDIEARLESASDPTALGQMATQINELGKSAGAIGLSRLEDDAKRIFDLWRSGGLTRTIACHESTQFRAKVLSELEGQLFLVVEHRNRKLYQESPRYSETLSGTNFEIEEARKCLALERETACVAHCMRALEVGLVATAVRLRVKAEDRDKKNWFNLIVAIEKRIKAKKDGSKRWRDSHGTTWSDTALEFGHFKDAWRNHCMHSRVKYNRADAERVLTHVESFLSRLSSQM